METVWVMMRIDDVRIFIRGCPVVFISVIFILNLQEAITSYVISSLIRR